MVGWFRTAALQVMRGTLDGHGHGVGKYEDAGASNSEVYELLRQSRPRPVAHVIAKQFRVAFALVLATPALIGAVLLLLLREAVQQSPHDLLVALTVPALVVLIGLIGSRALGLAFDANGISVLQAGTIGALTAGVAFYLAFGGLIAYLSVRGFDIAVRPEGSREVALVLLRVFTLAAWRAHWWWLASSGFGAAAAIVMTRLASGGKRQVR